MTQIDNLDRILQFTDKVGASVSVTQLTPQLQSTILRIVEASDKYYSTVEKNHKQLETTVAELRNEVSALRSTTKADPYVFTEEPAEVEDDLKQSAQVVQQLEKQVKMLTDKNANLLKQNTLLKQKLQTIKEGTSSEPYTIHENVAVFKTTSSVPSVANIAQGEFGDEEETMTLMPEILFPVVQKMASLLNRFEEKKYTHTTPLYQFADLFIQLAEEVRSLVAMENKVLEIRSPVYVFGDIHGNYKDLRFYLSRFNPTGRIGWLPHKLLFLGDYVDRGEHSIEVVARLFIDKICSRSKVYLLRGNHELSYVNSQIETYGQGCFRYQCQQVFKTRGEDVYWAINRAFDCLPLAAIIDHEIFCVHGGIPRPNLPNPPTVPSSNPPIRPPQSLNLEKVKNMPRSASTMNVNYSVFGSGTDGRNTREQSTSGKPPISPYGSAQTASQTSQTQQFATALGASASTVALLGSSYSNLSSSSFFHKSNDPRIDAIRAFPPSLPGTLQFHESCPLLSDLLWADPAPPDRMLDKDGYCMGVRGPDSVMFGQPAVEEFLHQSNLTLIIRAHEDQADGAQLCLNGKVFTVFSSSNYRDSNSGACLLCSDKKIHVVIKQCNLPRALTHSMSGTRLPSLFGEQSMPEVDHETGKLIIGDRTKSNQAQASLQQQKAVRDAIISNRPQSMVHGGTLVGPTSQDKIQGREDDHAKDSERKSPSSAHRRTTRTSPDSKEPEKREVGTTRRHLSPTARTTSSDGKRTAKK
ncbi:putative Serine/threonine-protein phosphatase [Blattamonas nauphoetae]|uniref:Serine/threonine-protein phosphatase n=1 Tax=Blattamonas nauphoetae TaxID=2049346 RepID=A0ABQ9XTB9_9EUKA|nr:putative Serine/threonine-protein phosphatase [Blattamonas nauphoetae]